MHRILSIAPVMLLSLAAANIAVAAEPPEQGQPADAGRLDVTGGGADEFSVGGGISSRTDLGDGTKVLHGVQVLLGPKNWLKEYAVFNKGILESRTQFYQNGRTFRSQRREHNGDGQEIVYTAERTKVLAEKVIVDGGVDIGPLTEQEVVCRGTVKADKRWEGAFLVWEPVPGEFGERVVMQEYRKGELVNSTPFSVEKLGLPPDAAREGSAAWPWRWPYDSSEWRVPPEWPAAPSPVSR